MHILLNTIIMDILIFFKILSKESMCLNIWIKLPIKFLTWGFPADEQGLEETESPGEHPWNLVAAFAQLKTSSVPDR